MTGKEPFILGVGRKIALYRKEAGFTQDELAEKSGKMINTISKLERGIGDPKLSTLLDISLALNVSLFEILAIDESSLTKYKRSNEKLISEINRILQELDERTLNIIKKQINVFKE